MTRTARTYRFERDEQGQVCRMVWTGDVPVERRETERERQQRLYREAMDRKAGGVSVERGT